MQERHEFSVPTDDASESFLLHRTVDAKRHTRTDEKRAQAPKRPCVSSRERLSPNQKIMRALSTKANKERISLELLEELNSFLKYEIEGYEKDLIKIAHYKKGAQILEALHSNYNILKTRGWTADGIMRLANGLEPVETLIDATMIDMTKTPPVRISLDAPNITNQRESNIGTTQDAQTLDMAATQSDIAVGDIAQGDKTLAMAATQNDIAVDYVTHDDQTLDETQSERDALSVLLSLSMFKTHPRTSQYASSSSSAYHRAP